MNEEYKKEMEKNQVQVGQVFLNYKQLCGYIGIPYTTGKQRILLKRHMLRYFCWEKIPGSQKIKIEAVYYDHPKEITDNRGGSSPKPTTIKMMQYFKQISWEDNFYSKTNLLVKMELQPKTPFQKKFRRNVRSLSTMLYDGLMNALGLIMREYETQVSQVVVNINTGEIMEDELKSKYLAIKRKVLGQFNARSERIIFQNKMWANYRACIDHYTYIDFKQTNIHERYWIRDWITEIDNPRITREELMNTAIHQLVENYRRNKNSIGVVSPEEYQKLLEEERNNILETTGQKMSPSSLVYP